MEPCALAQLFVAFFELDVESEDATVGLGQFVLEPAVLGPQSIRDGERGAQFLVHRAGLAPRSEAALREPARAGAVVAEQGNVPGHCRGRRCRSRGERQIDRGERAGGLGGFQRGRHEGRAAIAGRLDIRDKGDGTAGGELGFRHIGDGQDEAGADLGRQPITLRGAAHGCPQGRQRVEGAVHGCL